MINKVTVDFNKKHQTVESFGGSAAWWSQIVGKFPKSVNTVIIRGVSNS